MIRHPIFQKGSQLVRHFAFTRSVEVLALQASPMLGLYLAGFSFSAADWIRAGLLLLGSVLLTAHVFIFNDWAGHGTDHLDPNRAAAGFDRHGISRLQVAFAATALLLAANVIFALAGVKFFLIGAAITTLSLVYSCSLGIGKSTPIAASFIHLLGGSLHFFLGYTLFRPFDAAGMAISLFFGLVFAAGHLNQEVRDYEGDFVNGIRTSAVVFGCRRTFIASFCLFLAAYLILGCLAALGILPKWLLGSFLLMPLHIVWFLKAVRRGLNFETAVWMQQRYRLLFAMIGLAMLLR